MTSEEILPARHCKQGVAGGELVKDGTIEPDQVEDFENLDEEIQELVANGELDMSEAREV